MQSRLRARLHAEATASWRRRRRREYEQEPGGELSARTRTLLLGTFTLAAAPLTAASTTSKRDILQAGRGELDVEFEFKSEGES